MKIIGILTMTTLSVMIITIWSGYVLSVLWKWFFVSAFSVSDISIANAIGVSMVVNYMTYQYDSSNQRTDTRSGTEQLVSSILYGLLKPTFALFFGWVVHFWI